MLSERIARIDRRIRPVLVEHFPDLAIRLYSEGRERFVRQFDSEGTDLYHKSLDSATPVKLWGITFNSDIMNAAGMFKNGEGYETVCRQGAGAYMAGTATHGMRDGNTVGRTRHPFVSLPKSKAAMNCLGLPNPGISVLLRRLSEFTQYPGFPIWVSIARDSNDLEDRRDLYLANSLVEAANCNNVSVIEVNESCPNTGEAKSDYHELVSRLGELMRVYESKTKRQVPVVAKFSNDTNPNDVPLIMDALFGAGFSGVNFGNTSTNYESGRDKIAPGEELSYATFHSKFKGGLSGRPLKESSLELASRAVRYARAGNGRREFHVIRTGGIEGASDIVDSREAGVSMNQWFTGYWERFSRDGHRVYKAFYEELKKIGA